MKKITTILSPLVLLATTALAQDSTCILQPSCSQLGYTSSETDCGTAKVLRCPFDVSQVACVGGSSGAGGDGGSGGESNETDEFGTVDNSACQVGYIYYSDDTCSPEYNYFKDAIGIVFDTKRRYIIGLNCSSDIRWVTHYLNDELLPPTPDELSIARDLNGKNNTATIIADSGNYPAAEYCAGLTDGNKEWFLPSGGEWHLYELSHAEVKNSLSKIKYASVGLKSCNNVWVSNIRGVNDYIVYHPRGGYSFVFCDYTSSHSAVCFAEY